MADTVAGSELVAAYQLGAQRLRARTRTVTEAAWTGLGSYDTPDVERFTALAADITDAAASAAAGLSEAFVASYVAAETGEAVRLPGAAALVRPVPAEVVYARPFHQMWRDLSVGLLWTEARDRARNFAGTLAYTDAQLALRSSWTTSMSSSPRITGYRRVLNSPSCGLCVVASTQRYSRGDLMPIHHRCDCTVEPIVGGSPNTRVIDGERLELVKRRLASEDGTYTRAAIRRMKIDVDDLPAVEVRMHGEMGPVLTFAGQAFNEGPQ